MFRGAGAFIATLHHLRDVVRYSRFLANARPEALLSAEALVRQDNGSRRQSASAPIEFMEDRTVSTRAVVN